MTDYIFLEICYCQQHTLKRCFTVLAVFQCSQQLSILTAEVVDFIVVCMFGVQKSCNFLQQQEFRVVRSLLCISTATSTPNPQVGSATAFINSLWTAGLSSPTARVLVWSRSPTVCFLPYIFMFLQYQLA